LGPGARVAVARRSPSGLRAFARRNCRISSLRRLLWRVNNMLGGRAYRRVETRDGCRACCAEDFFRRLLWTALGGDRAQRFACLEQQPQGRCAVFIFGSSSAPLARQRDLRQLRMERTAECKLSQGSFFPLFAPSAERPLAQIRSQIDFGRAGCSRSRGGGGLLHTSSSLAIRSFACSGHHGHADHRLHSPEYLRSHL